MKTNITFNDTPRWGNRRLMNEPDTHWLVKMVVIQDEEISIVEVIQATCFDEAVFNAFGTRNIPSSWKITEVEEVE